MLSSDTRQIIFNFTIGQPYVVVSSFAFFTFSDNNRLTCSINTTLVKLDKPVGESSMGPKITHITKKLIQEGFQKEQITIISPYFRSSTDKDMFLLNNDLYTVYELSQGHTSACIFEFSREDVVENLYQEACNTLEMKQPPFIELYKSLAENIAEWQQGIINTDTVLKLLNDYDFVYHKDKHWGYEQKVAATYHFWTPTLKCTYQRDEHQKGLKNTFLFQETYNEDVVVNALSDILKYKYIVHDTDIPTLVEWLIQSAKGKQDNSLIENKMVYVKVEDILTGIREYLMREHEMDLNFIRGILSIRLNNYNYDIPYKLRGNELYKLRRGYSAIQRWKETHCLANLTNAEEMVLKGKKEMGKRKLLNQPINTFRVFVDRDLNIVDTKAFFEQAREERKKWRHVY